MDIQGIRKEFSDRRSLAGIVDGLGLARPKEQFVGLLTRFGECAEEGTNVPFQNRRIPGELRAIAKSGERQEDEKVLAAALPNLVPGLFAGDSANQGERAL